MPELPEVEYARKVAASVAEGERIESVICEDDPIVFEGVTPAKIKRSLKGRRVLTARRHGKQFWLELDSGSSLMIHLGMTGHIRTPGSRRLKLAADPETVDEQWPPRFVKLELAFASGEKLAFTNARRFGRVRIEKDPMSVPPVSKLGFDPVESPPGEMGFREALAKRRGLIKSLLLNQRFVAGVGNWIADEILYQAGIDPSRTANSLSPEESDRIYGKLLEIIRFAISVDANKQRFPKDWLFHYRWGKTEGAKTADGETIVFDTIGGRTTAWVPSIQQ